MKNLNKIEKGIKVLNKNSISKIKGGGDPLKQEHPPRDGTIVVVNLPV